MEGCAWTTNFFGDIVTFDTTFATNKDHRSLGVFIGFNHCREQVIFGASLLYDETQESFDWIFNTFLEAHKFKKLTTLFTDQDIAMGNAIDVVMPEVRHNLCTFHIMQNAIKHLGSLMKDDSCFLSDFKALMFEFEDVTKFEKEWEALLKNYKVRGNSWLERTYALKEKCTRCYMKTTVTLRVRSTQRSESMNAKLKKSLKSKLDIPTFFKLFSMVVSEKRYREVETEYNAKEKMPREKSLLALVGNKQDKGRLEEYLIVSCDEEGEHVVTHDEENATLSCSCRKFETVGILCGHALKVLDVLGVKYILETYILKRWTRGARDGCALEDDGLDIHRSEGSDISDWYRELWPDAVKDGYLIYKSRMKELDKEIEELRKKHFECMDHGCEPIGNKGVNTNAIESLVGNVKGIKKKMVHKKEESSPLPQPPVQALTESHEMRHETRKDPGSGEGCPCSQLPGVPDAMPSEDLLPSRSDPRFIALTTSMINGDMSAHVHGLMLGVHSASTEMVLLCFTNHVEGLLPPAGICRREKPDAPSPGGVGASAAGRRNCGSKSGNGPLEASSSSPSLVHISDCWIVGSGVVVSPEGGSVVRVSGRFTKRCAIAVSSPEATDGLRRRQKESEWGP
ncbi:hypothetical protein RJ640_024578 [Escallonia rubra]|uniref:SWIM-type domain-containing protein n=1 Tax=Escallonia rubra TaxID=112253 RepID=A0AA88RUX7_9ASTE|nr:hypothetical protein RJ640_024578 [Escallonia rubra]